MNTIYLNYRNNDSEDSLRFYNCAEEGSTPIYLPSVTTILSTTQDKSWMKVQEKKRGKKAWDAYCKEAAERGTLMHEWLEIAYTNNIKSHTELLEKVGYSPFSEDVIEHRAALLIERFFRRRCILEFSEVIAYETPVFHIEKEIRGGYAGRFDMLIKDYRDKIVLIDFKSSSYVKSEDEIHNYFMQLGAYWRAISVMGNYQAPQEAQVILTSDKVDWSKRYTLSKDEAKLWYFMFRGAVYEFYTYHLLAIKNQNPDYARLLDIPEEYLA